jgi:hypothetical protein
MLVVLAVSLEVRDAIKRRVCTYTTTGDHFHHQFWYVRCEVDTHTHTQLSLMLELGGRYYCRTCGFVGGKGICVVCKEICHVGHDVSSEPEFGEFYWYHTEILIFNYKRDRLLSLL